MGHDGLSKKRQTSKHWALMIVIMIPVLIETVAYIRISSDSRGWGQFATECFYSIPPSVDQNKRNLSVKRCSEDRYWHDRKRIAVVTALFGKFEKTLKDISEQTLPFDAIAFADRPLEHPRWQVDTYPWHYNNSNAADFNWNCSLRNSFCNNDHPYLIYKYYKAQLHRIPLLEKYDLILWLDGRLVIENSTFLDDWCSQLILEQSRSPLIALNHGCNMTFGLWATVNDAHWSSGSFFGREQPKQALAEQVNSYRARGYRDDWYRTVPGRRHDASYWRSGVILWNMRHRLTSSVLDRWWEEILTWSTQCQLSLAYLSWEFRVQWATWNSRGHRGWPLKVLRHGH